MTAETIMLLAGAILSLGFSYVPGLSGWFERLGEAEEDGGTRKRLVMLALLVLATGGVYGLACSGWGADFGVAVRCDRPGLAGILTALVAAIVANQSVYKISPKAPRASGKVEENEETIKEILPDG
jgi:hypothetical protein